MAAASTESLSTYASNLNLIKQGAEAKVYTCTFHDRPTIVKERFRKHYRHPVLDMSLTSQRTKSEVKCMLRCRMHGIHTPAVYFVDLQMSRIYMEHVVDSQTVKEYIKDVQAKQVALQINETQPLLALAGKIGAILGTMHQKRIIHGDLTTSNLLLIGSPVDLHICMIDFGLGSLDGSAEDKAVDLYVLERALLSTHPSTEYVFEAIINSYTVAYKAAGGAKEIVEIIGKLEEVRRRGRKRTMVG